MAESSVTPAARVSKPIARGWHLLLTAFLTISLIALAAVLALAGFEFAYAERIYPGVSVAGIPLGGRTIRQAEIILQRELTPFPAPKIILQTPDKTLPLDPEHIGARLDARATAAAAYRVGRHQSLWEDLREQALTWRDGREIAPVVIYDEQRIRLELERLAQEIYRPVREARLELRGTEPVAIPGQVGQEMDVAATLALVMERLERRESGVIQAVIRRQEPVIADLSQAEEAVRAFLRAPVQLANESQGLSYTLEPERLAELMRLESQPGTEGGDPVVVPKLDREKLRALVESWAQEIAVEPRDARIDLDPETWTFTVLQPSQKGRTLDVDETIARIERAVTEGPRVQELPIKVLEPAVDEHKIDEMGIRELVSRGESRFAGSSAARVHNIVTAAEKFRGVVIPPGQEVSFNRIIGDVTKENGFEDSLIIWGDRTAVGIGGGVCQVSTTLFRAAFFGGFPILERWAHGYVVSWYGEPGMDATIYTPDIDFRFLNDTGHYLLIKPELDTRRGTLAFSLYGTKPDREVEMIGPIIENRQPPPDPLYQEDPNLPPGVVKQVDWAQEGMDVTVTRIVKNSDGEEIGRDVFVSHYQPWRAVYLVGPKPAEEPQPEPTASPTPTDESASTPTAP